VAIKKSELYSSLWASCDKLRGGMDASQYKDYVLVMLFMKYVSDKAASRPDYDLEVPKGGSFADMVAAIGDKEIGDKINKIIGRLAAANESLNGAINVADFNDASKLGSGKEMVDRLSDLVAIFNKPALDFRKNSADGDDLLGDAYEYLMRNFATESGKSKGQFYTPSEVSRIMAQVIGLGSAHDPNQTIYDPTCGSGSLLLKAHDEAKSRTGLDLAIYGQEMDNATSALARMNMVLHDATTATIWQGNTLAAPHFTDQFGGLKTFDYVVANPPFSNKSWTTGFDPAHDQFGRFPYELPPAKNGDYAFLLHILTSLKSTGTGAVILPHGVLFRGNSEAAIRREVVSRGYIKGIIGLPANLFYGTGIPAAIIVLDKAGAATRKGIFMIDASRGFIKDGNKNRLRAQDMRRIVDVFTSGLEQPRYSRFVPVEEIRANEYNLNLPRYIDSSDPEDIQDIDGHLRGGIPDRDLDALDAYWQVMPNLRADIFESAGRPGYSKLKVPASEIDTIISEHPDFKAFSSQIEERFQTWRAFAERLLRSMGKGCKPKEILAKLGDGILADFAEAPLLDPYDIYQCLCSYWDEALQDDAYLIADVGWLGAAKPRLIVQDKDQKTKVEPDFALGKDKFHSDLLPARILVAEYFALNAEALEALEALIASEEDEIAAIADDHAVEGGLLEDVFDEKGKPDRKVVASRLNDSANDDESADEHELLGRLSKLIGDISDARALLKKALVALDAGLANTYGRLADEETRSLAVERKWLRSLGSDVQNEVTQLRLHLLTALRNEHRRYDLTLGQVNQAADHLRSKVEEHLRKLDSAWLQ
jgi:type I restriction enzyme M protein